MTITITFTSVLIFIGRVVVSFFLIAIPTVIYMFAHFDVSSGPWWRGRTLLAVWACAVIYMVWFVLHVRTR